MSLGFRESGGGFRARSRGANLGNVQEDIVIGAGFQLLADDGTLLLPGISFQSDDAVGLARPSSSALGIVSDGTLNFYPNGSTLRYFMSATAFQPNASDVHTLGVAAQRWDQIYLSESVRFSEHVSPTGVANDAILFAKDNGAGKTQLVVIFGTGAEQVLATEP